MQIYTNIDSKKWKEISSRPQNEPGKLEKKVRKILEKVKLKGDKALRKYTETLDGVTLKQFDISPGELAASETSLDENLKKAIDQAYKNIFGFHSQQKETKKIIETMPGVLCWREQVAIQKVGLYVPGGTAPLFSTVLMLGIPAQIAGCSEIILCTPPNAAGSVHPAVLYAAKCCGITRIFKLGGAQAIAAMAYGTETVPAVFRIFGPGNRYVTLAKQLIQQQGIAIDMPAGPSELLVIADETAVPEFVAADLLSQAEHGSDSQVLLLTTSKELANLVMDAIMTQVKALPRKALAEKSLEHSKIVVVKNINEAINLSNDYAPEHLILAIKNADNYIPGITAAGSVFIGNYSPESAGDYASGTNHVLPTNGYAAMYSGVSCDQFYKKITYQQLSEEGLRNISATVMEMAAAEGLEAHKNAIAIRLK